MQNYYAASKLRVNPRAEVNSSVTEAPAMAAAPAEQGLISRVAAFFGKAASAVTPEDIERFSEALANADESGEWQWSEIASVGLNIVLGAVLTFLGVPRMMQQPIITGVSKVAEPLIQKLDKNTQVTEQVAADLGENTKLTAAAANDAARAADQVLKHKTD